MTDRRKKVAEPPSRGTSDHGFGPLSCLFRRWNKTGSAREARSWPWTLAMIEVAFFCHFFQID